MTVLPRERHDFLGQSSAHFRDVPIVATAAARESDT